MAIGTVTVTTAANWIPENWHPELSDAVQAHVGLSDLVDRSFDSTMKNGDILRISDRANLAVRAKSADTSATWSNVTETQQNITINRQVYNAFLVENITELQSQHAVRSEYTGNIVYSLMSFVEGDLSSGLASLPNSFSQLVGALGSDPTTDNMIRSVQYLDDADVPEGERFFYISPGTHAALLKQDVFINADYGPAGGVTTGRITKPVFGATVHVSTLASNNPSTSGQSYSWFCHRRGVALIMQQTPDIQSHWIPLEFGWGTTADVIYQFAERLILPKAAASTSPNDNFNVAVRGP
jgi:hypothetical protein